MIILVTYYCRATRTRAWQPGQAAELQSAVPTDIMTEEKRQKRMLMEETKRKSQTCFQSLAKASQNKRQDGRMSCVVALA